jgi:hypothetical protein
MSETQSPDRSLFYEILLTLERMRAPYMIIGAFAGTVDGKGELLHLNFNQI